MIINIINWKKLTLTVLCLLAFCSINLAPAQITRARANRRQNQSQPSNQNKPFTFGDITLYNYDTMSVELGRSAEAHGDKTTVDAVDVKQNITSRLLARDIIAYMLPKSNQVERIEATGSMRFSQKPTAKSEKSQNTISCSGSKGIYYKKEARLVVLGPVKYHFEQPTADGKAINTIDGTCDKVTYDEVKQSLEFSGGVDLIVVVPEMMDKPAPVSGDVIIINMAVKPYKININNKNSGGSIKITPKD